MPVTLVGLGCGTEETLTVEGSRALRRAELILGAPRLLDALPEGCALNRQAAIRPEEIAAAVGEDPALRSCVVYSGDTGFYSGARVLLPLLKAAGVEAKVLPGLSSIQVLAARLGRPWQDWKLCSAHGIQCDPVSAVMEGRPVFFLTGGAVGPAQLCRRLVQADLGTLAVTVGERLTYEDERITQGRAEELAERRFHPLSVLLAEAVERQIPPRTPGFADECFLREEIPMTKQEVRAAALAKLAVSPGDIVWDVGAGTGSVSVELALSARKGQVFAVERDKDACALIRRNRAKFGAWNLAVVPGQAPEALDALPPPDAVFIGGTGGQMDKIMGAVQEKNPKARMCISAIALETVGAAISALAGRGFGAEVVQIGVSRAKDGGRLHMLTANNPVFLITKGKTAEAGL